MGIKKLFQRIHDNHPTLGRTLSLATASTAITANSIGLGLPLCALGAFKVATGSDVASTAVIALAKRWIHINNRLIDTILPQKDWRIELPDGLDENKQYLLISNHQTWVDTSIVQYISENRLPLTRFFTKFDLIYIPFVGQAFYFLDFPMMKRPSKKALAKNPALRQRNLLEAERACKLLENKPFALLNYLEGTRFSSQKHSEQNSPYTHLLKPKAGGLTLAISALGQQVDGILDMTIVYPDGIPEYADLWRGNIKRLGVHVRRLDIPQELFADIEQKSQRAHQVANTAVMSEIDNKVTSKPTEATESTALTEQAKDEAIRTRMYAWLDEIWQQKDQQMTKMLADFTSDA